MKLRQEIVGIQSRLDCIKSHDNARSRRACLLSRSLFFHWKKINNLHFDIIQRNSVFLLRIALKHGVFTVRFEDLSFSKHSPKRKKPYLTFWQVHWFFSQLQAHATPLLERYGIKVQLVNVRHTSHICSECHRLKVQDFAERKHATRSTKNSKHFSCSNPRHAKRNGKKFRLDADLNAARNIALSPPIISFQVKDFRATPSPALA